MQKIFEEYGGVIVTVIAVVALIALVTLLMSDGGVLEGAFNDIVEKFTNTSNSLIDSAINSATNTITNTASNAG